MKKIFHWIWRKLCVEITITLVKDGVCKTDTRLNKYYFLIQCKELDVEQKHFFSCMGDGQCGNAYQAFDRTRLSALFLADSIGVPSIIIYDEKVKKYI